MSNKNFRQLIRYSVKSNLKAEMNRYALSYMWWFIEPALHLITLYIVFGIFLGQNQNTQYIPFLFCGLVPWFWFNKTISNGMNSIIDGKHIIKETYIHKSFFPTVSVVQDTTKELFVFIILILVLLLSGISPTLNWLFLPLVILLEFLLITAITFFLAIITPYFIDLRYLTSAALQLIMFGSGTFYDYKTMPIKYQEIFVLNPCALLLNMYRDILMNNKSLAIKDCFYVLYFVLFFGAINCLLYRKLDKDIPKTLLH